MNRFETEAIVLRVVEHGESDLIVRLLTPDRGRLTVIAKGARRSIKRFPGTLDVFNRLQVGVRQRRAGMGFLEQARLLSAYLPLRENLRRYALGSWVVELLDRMAPEGGHGADVARIYAFAIEILEALCRLEPDLQLRLLVELRALDALGLRPELARCVRCGDAPDGTDRLSFHVADGGLVCRACQDDRGHGLVPVHLGTLKALERGLGYDLDLLGRLVFSAAALEEAETLLFRFQRFHVGMELRSERFLAECFAQAPAGCG